MRSLIAFTAASFLLSGCFLLGKMEDGMDKTNASVADSNRLIGETKDGQQLAEALNLMTDEKISPHMRVTATETVMKLAAEDRIAKYFGMPTLHQLLNVDKNVEGRTLNVPNVALIGEAIDEATGVAPVNENVYQVQSTAVLGMLEQLAFKSKMPGQTDVDLDAMRKVTKRLLTMAPGVLGGVKLQDLKVAYATAKPRPFAVSQAKRQKASFLIGELLRQLSFDEDDKRAAKVNIEARLGVGAYH